MHQYVSMNYQAKIEGINSLQVRGESVIHRIAYPCFRKDFIESNFWSLFSRIRIARSDLYAFHTKFSINGVFLEKKRIWHR